MKKHIFKDGEFFLGCNYWASHAGTNMWNNWRPDIISHDFELLAKSNVKILRIFPLWSDFQPIRIHYAQSGAEREIRIGEDVLPNTEAGKAGVSEIMAQRFSEFLDLAEKNGIKLVVGLITGWMSGRLHVPEIFSGVNVLTDPRAIKWQIKFVKYMVKRFKNHSAIVAWDLGNECNCLAPTKDCDEAYLWVSSITMAIKTEDSERPVISGMHGSFPESNFRPEDLGEILDVLCTHPYPLFTPHCSTDPIVENKSVMHSVAETVLYRGLSGKPAFAEEIGTLGPMIASDENAAAYVNTILHLLWMHNCLGFMWWCGFEQTKLTHTPYDWDAVERELGLFYEDYKAKPVLNVISDFADFIDNFKYKNLSPRIVDAVCIISAEDDTWLSAYGTFILAKQAGLDIEFCYVDDEIPDARAYIMPSIAHSHIKNHIMRKIMSRVEHGAVLYISMGNGLLSPFKEFIGLKPKYRYNPTKPDKVEFDNEVFNFMPEFKIDYEECTAKPMAFDNENRPVMSEHSYGKGTVYYLGYQIEDIAASKPGVMSGREFIPYYKFYSAMNKLRNPEKKVRKNNPFVAITEHKINENTRIVVCANCVPRESRVSFTFEEFTYSCVLKNQNNIVNENKNGIEVVFKPNSCMVFEINKK